MSIIKYVNYFLMVCFSDMLTSFNDDLVFCVDSVPDSDGNEEGSFRCTDGKAILLMLLLVLL